MQSVIRRLVRALLGVTLGLLLSAATAQPAVAADNERIHVANKTALHAAVGGAIGGVLGTGAGFGLALATCRRNVSHGAIECYNDIILMPSMGGIGAIIGVAIGASMGAARAGRRPANAAWSAAGVGFVGAVVLFGGVVFFNAPVAVAGGAVLLIGAPVTAARVARGSKSLEAPAVLPVVQIGRGRLVLGMQGRF